MDLMLIRYSLERQSSCQNCKLSTIPAEFFLCNMF